MASHFTELKIQNTDRGLQASLLLGSEPSFTSSKLHQALSGLVLG